MTLAKQTVIGAGAMMKAGLGEPDELRRNVTSPNGTTQAGLDALMSGGGCRAWCATPSPPLSVAADRWARRARATRPAPSTPRDNSAS